MCEADQGSALCSRHGTLDRAANPGESTRGCSLLRSVLQISLGGAIGTGLYLGIANALATGGPVSIRVSGEGGASFSVLTHVVASSDSWVSSSATR